MSFRISVLVLETPINRPELLHWLLSFAVVIRKRAILLIAIGNSKIIIFWQVCGVALPKILSFLLDIMVNLVVPVALSKRIHVNNILLFICISLIHHLVFIALKNPSCLIQIYQLVFGWLRLSTLHRVHWVRLAKNFFVEAIDAVNWLIKWALFELVFISSELNGK